MSLPPFDLLCIFTSKASRSLLYEVGALLFSVRLEFERNSEVLKERPLWFVSLTYAQLSFADFGSSELFRQQQDVWEGDLAF